MIVVGAALVIAAIAYLLLFKSQPELASVPVPTQVGGLSLINEITGSAALQEFTQLHGQSFPVLSGSKASYGTGNQAILWIAGTASPEVARKLLEEMRDKLAEGRSPFQPTSVRNIENHEVYTLDGMGQKHFYFQSGKYLIWLAANSEIADQALQQTLDFYQ